MTVRRAAALAILETLIVAFALGWLGSALGVSGPVIAVSCFATGFAITRARLMAARS